MKKILVVSALAVVISLLIVPLSAAAVPQARNEPLPVTDVTDEAAIAVLPVKVQQLVLPLLKDHPDLVRSIAVSDPLLVSNLCKSAGTNSSLLTKLWNVVFFYRLLRVLFCAGMYGQFPSKIMAIRTLTWTVKLINWVKVGLLLGIVEPPVQPEKPEISFAADPVAKTITITDVNSTDVQWSTIVQVGNGTCDPLPTGNVTVGQVITNCSGYIILWYLLTDEVLFASQFP